MSDHHASKLERYRDFPMRWGGLGGSGGSAFPGTRRVSIGTVGTGMGSTGNGVSLAQSLLEEDEVCTPSRLAGQSTVIE